MDTHWSAEGLQRLSIEHFYHVGSSEELRHGMTKALITNAPIGKKYVKPETSRQFVLEMV